MSSLQSLKNALINQSSGREEKVEVNQRHLIDKILARYSAEFTVYRELLQNSNDAGATEAQIVFRLSQPEGLFGTRRVTTVEYKNNGRPFTVEDWHRLRSIAEGNPDEQKIGFFGVGFYSLFSITEEPFVSSGKECMAFFWKGDQLFTKKGDLPAESVSQWTTFYLALREPMDVPVVNEFGRFIATSIAFTSNLRKVEVLFDDSVVLSFDKKIADPKPLTIKRDSYTLVSPNNIFNLLSVSIKQAQLDVTAYLDFEVRSKNMGRPSEFRLFMRTAVGELSVKLSDQYIREMERTTKKKPPLKTTIQIMFANHDEYESSSGLREGYHKMFEYLIPAPTEQGKIFIGFPTHQTTGCAMQLAAHLIPTVERESIDFVDRTLNVFNQEVLCMGGVLSRIVYDDEISSIARLYSEMPKDPEIETWLQKKASHLMTSFAFKPSTPSVLVSRILGLYFFKSAKSALQIVSNNGIKTADQVRMPDAAMKGFIKSVPILPDGVAKSCDVLVGQLREQGHLSELKLSDVFTELASRTLSEDELVALMKWWISYRSRMGVSQVDIDRILSSTVWEVVNGKETSVRTLSQIKYYINRQILPPESLVPDTVIPFSVSKGFSKDELEHNFGKWKELTTLEWAQFITALPEFSSDAAFVEKTMSVFSRQYASLNLDARSKLVTLLTPLRCIPTKSGLKLPNESYFKTVTLFSDLPVVSLQHNKSIGEPFMKVLGVREHVELQMVFDRLTDLNWDHMQLIKYLSSVQVKLSNVELGRLKLTPLFPSENADSTTRFVASDLYAPNDTLRGFGLPLLNWKGKWKTYSDEAKFMATLGLRQYIPVPDFVEMASKATPERRSQLLAYFIDGHKAYYATTYEAKSVKTSFLPAKRSGENILASPTECFSEDGSSVLGFAILHYELKSNADKFGVQPHPSPDLLIREIERNPPSLAKANAIFNYFASRQSDFTPEHWRKMRDMNFIPLDREKNSSFIWVPPTQVYFGGSQSYYLDFFDYIDFGPKANSFLRACGVKDEPSPTELAQQLVRNPKQFFATSGVEKYLSMLRQIAAHFYQIRQNGLLLRQMKETAFLIGVRAEDPAQLDSEDSSSSANHLQFELAKASDIFLIDDTILNQIFCPLGAPMESLLEEFYGSLGSVWLSKQVSEVHQPRGTMTATKAAVELQQLIRDRAPLLMYEGTSQLRNSKDIAPNAEATLKSLQVLEVPEIEIIRTFLGKEKRQKTTACLLLDKRSGGYFLTISGEFDYFDVSSAIGKLMFKKVRLNDALLLSTLLSTSLINLKRKGFPVDRILNLTASRVKEAALLQEQARKMKLEREAKEKEERERLKSETPPPVPKKPEPEVDPLATAQPDIAETAKSLMKIFPDVDPGFARQELEKLGSRMPKDQKLQELSNRWLENSYQKSQPKREKAATEPPMNEIQKTTPESQPKPQPQNTEQLEEDNLYNMINRFGKQFGLWEGTSSTSSSSDSKAETPALPPRKSETKSETTTEVRKGNTVAPGPPSNPLEQINPEFTKSLKNQLSKSLQSLQTNQNSGFRAEIPGDNPTRPELPRNSLSANHCTIISDNDLILHYDRIESLALFYDRRVENEAISIVSSPTGMKGLRRFAGLLKLLANVFTVTPNTMHIYFDQKGETVAFNRNKTLFFNARYYLGLHFIDGPTEVPNESAPLLDKEKRSNMGGFRQRILNLPGAFGNSGAFTPPEPTETAVVRESDSEAYYYWFMVACHELAHNWVSEHNSQHEFYLSSFAQYYMKNLVRTLQEHNVNL